MWSLKEELEKMMIAIKQMRSVVSVRPHVRTWDDSLALDRARNELRLQLWTVLYPESSK
jgi:hypothetical protein